MRSRTWTRFYVLGALCVLLSAISLTARADVTRVTLSGPGTYGEDDDYFTRVWGNPRDMSDQEDVYLIWSNCAPQVRSRWTGVSLANGVWSAVTSAVGESRWVSVLNPGWISSLDMGEDGQLHKIDTSRYRQLTFRMRVASGVGTTTSRIEWADSPIGAPLSAGITPFRVLGDGVWHIYSLDLGVLSEWTRGPVAWLWFNFGDLPAGHRVDIDWVRLTPRQNRRVEWQGDALQGVAKVYLGPDAAHPEQYGSLLVYEGNVAPKPIDAGAGALVVPASLPGGEYYARVEVGGRGANSARSWRFMPLPIAEFAAPSYTSGEDWATAVLGNAWDMAGLDDFDQETTAMDTLRSVSVKDGKLTVVSKDDGRADCDTAWPHRPLGLNMGGQYIDPAKYRYLSYRYKVDDAPNQGAGGVTRIRWQARRLSHWPTGRTDDISLYDNGWHTYSVDLRSLTPEEGGGLEGEKGEWKDIPADVMQIMLHESHRQWTSHLDWVMLTAENVATGSYVVRWRVVGTQAPLTTTLYWAEKQGASFRLVSGSGEVVTRAAMQETQVLAAHVVYLPMVMDNYGGESDTRQYAKSTQGLTKGQAYYVAIKLDDGYQVSWWYSEVPVRVR